MSDPKYGLVAETLHFVCFYCQYEYSYRVRTGLTWLQIEQMLKDKNWSFDGNYWKCNCCRSGIK